MSSRPVLVAALLLVAAGAAAPARADVVRLTSGGVVRGQVVSETRTEVVVRTASGTAVIPRREVEAIERDGTGPDDAVVALEAEYRRRLAAIDRSDAEARYALGLWLKARGAKALARREFEAAVALDPAHRFAREELGARGGAGRTAPGATPAGAALVAGPEVGAALSVVRAGGPAEALALAWRTLDALDVSARPALAAALHEVERDLRRELERAARRGRDLLARQGPEAARLRALERWRAERDEALAAVAAGQPAAAVERARAAWAQVDALQRRDLRPVLELEPEAAAAVRRALLSARARLAVLLAALDVRGLASDDPPPELPAPALALLAARAGDVAAADLGPWDAALVERLGWERVLAHNVAVVRSAPPAHRPTPDELEQVRLTNEHRLALGRPPLELDLRLVSAARGHADDMARLGFFDHASPVPGCESPHDRLARAGYAGAGGENIALGPDAARAAHEQWVGSPAHHRNLLDPAWRAVGVGRAGRLWTQCFGVESALDR
ncbi:MAG: CAP domain-containing protein [Planctomycetes bacterium]|nr:CAP domain-containing protein [Planctomycetota bacterium]